MKRMWSKNELKKINQEETRKLLQSGEEVIDGTWEEDIDLTIRPEWLNGLTLKNSFAKLQVKNGVAYIVLSLILANETENEVSTSNAQYIAVQPNIPENISNKIFRKNGKKVSEAVVDSISNILTKQAYTSTLTGGTINGFSVTLNSNEINQIELFPRSTLAISATDSKCFDFRVFITL